ncbi:protein ANTAGONIST OF LIKE HETEROCHROMATIN PROTEIN 1-like [Temnothorax curvispinosus]|uniref:Protein ANTAGONIST OF LIKE HETEROCHROMATIN PROTEIN 1-like n=1 Tax=Temnothorax curvispinosus TaxID=300111 RepID=A0A6J1QN70_9HYME|nr:protein ANTAGONIST OF LIKE HETEROCHROMATIN PROTEIN 1-like [Temnothorax curvispinosus]
MSLGVFNKLVNKVTPLLEKISNQETISPEHRLIITLRYLSTGDEISSIALQFRVSKSTVHNIIGKTTTAIAHILIPEYVKSPNEAQWKEISKGFYEDWNMPNCVGAVDGKHVQIQAPPNSGSMCFNYKNLLVQF